ncbi:MAG: HAD family phosphatase [Kiritimatiellae bacterium]|nr:HAD family phosphatase [Kiritimatiellia bacterium]
MQIEGQAIVGAVRAVFFDLDGVLIDSEALWRDAIGKTFATAGISLDDGLYAMCAGLDTREGVRKVLERFPDCQADADVLGREIEAAVHDAFARDPHPMPGADGLLKRLCGLRIPLALVSASPMALIDLVLRSQQWQKHFRTIVSSEGMRAGKPDPGVYLEAIRRMGVGAADGIALEDTLAGVRAAHAAGLRVLAIPGYRSELAAIGQLAERVAPDLRAAADWLLRVVGQTGRAWGACENERLETVPDSVSKHTGAQIKGVGAARQRPGGGS